eukprot:scaffold9412_cov263-Amphora_coffeaeformis.AAC.1
MSPPSDPAENGRMALPSDNNNDCSWLLEGTLADLSSCGYQCFTGPMLPTAKNPTSCSDLQVGNLVWILKSKGRRRKTNGSSAAASCTTTTSMEGTTETPVSSQRFELFCRARIIADPENTCMDGKAEDDTLSDIKSTPNSRDTEITTDQDKLGSNDDDATSSARVWIRYPKGSTYHVKCNRLCRVLEHERGMIVVWPETDVYRKCCLTHTLPADEAFIEIGCDHGPTVDRIASFLTDPTLVLGIDKAADSIASARQRYPQYTFVQWDCLAEDDESAAKVIPPELQDLIQRQCQSFHLAVDINGNRELPAVLACLRRLLVNLELRPRLVFVKSRALFHELTIREK